MAGIHGIENGEIIHADQKAGTLDHIIKTASRFLQNKTHVFEYLFKLLFFEDSTSEPVVASIPSCPEI